MNFIYSGKHAFAIFVLVCAGCFGALLQVHVYDEEIAVFAHEDSIKPDYPSPDAPFAFEKPRYVTGSHTVVVVMVDFDGMAGTKDKAYFENILFGNTGSMKRYFEEASYGKFTLTGAVATPGWVRMPHSYEWYKAQDEPTILAEEALNATDSYIDYSQYDADGNGAIGFGELHVCIITAGPETWVPNGESWSYILWPYKQYFPHDVFLDGKKLGVGYFECQESSGMGAYAHEFGHELGLADLYDSKHSSNALGLWEMMCIGNWACNSISPTHMTSYYKAQLGWLSPQYADANVNSYPLRAVEMFPDALRLNISSCEYFLVENRERVGFDSCLPGEGLLILHIDESVVWPYSACATHKLVDIEEADNFGLDQNGADQGSATDTWYKENAFGKMGFTTSSEPSSEAYTGNCTYWAITNISSPKTNMTFALSGPFDETRDTPGAPPNATADFTGRISQHSLDYSDFDSDSAYETLSVDCTLESSRLCSAFLTLELYNWSGIRVAENYTYEIFLNASSPLSGVIDVSAPYTGLFYAYLLLWDADYQLRDCVYIPNIWLQNELYGAFDEYLSGVSCSATDANGDGVKESMHASYTANGQANEDAHVRLVALDPSDKIAYSAWDNFTLSSTGSAARQINWQPSSSGYYAIFLEYYDSSDDLEDAELASSSILSDYIKLDIPHIGFADNSTTMKDNDGDGFFDTVVITYRMDTTLPVGELFAEIEAKSDDGTVTELANESFVFGSVFDENITRYGEFTCNYTDGYTITIRVSAKWHPELQNALCVMNVGALHAFVLPAKIISKTPSTASLRMNPCNATFSVIADAQGAAYQWNLDGASVQSTGAYASIAFSSGAHYVEVVVLNGTRETRVRWNVTINAPPVAQLSQPPSKCEKGVEVHFNASASDSEGNVSEYQFDFGDGNISPWQDSPTVTHSYSDAGTYEVKVRARDSEGLEGAWSNACSIAIGEPAGLDGSWLGMTLLICGLGFALAFVVIVVLVIVFLVIRKKRVKQE